MADDWQEHGDESHRQMSCSMAGTITETSACAEMPPYQMHGSMAGKTAEASYRKDRILSRYPSISMFQSPRCGGDQRSTAELWVTFWK